MAHTRFNEVRTRKVCLNFDEKCHELLTLMQYVRAYTRNKYKIIFPLLPFMRRKEEETKNKNLYTFQKLQHVVKLKRSNE